jgi:hypothetical protein
MLEYINENIGFFLKVVITHVVTYILCGTVFYRLNNYGEWIKKDKPFVWRSMDSLIFKLAPVFQILRGILFGIVLLLIKDSIIDTNFGFLKLFSILTIVGLFNTYQPSHGSIEGFIYIKPDEDISIRQDIGGFLEVLTQIFIFSVIVTTNWRELISSLFG